MCSSITKDTGKRTGKIGTFAYQIRKSYLKHLVSCYIWSEGWIIHKAEEKQIEAFEMWCYRRVLRVSWIDHRTNEWVLSRLEVEKSLLARIRTLKLSYYGHIMLSLIHI